MSADAWRRTGSDGRRCFLCGRRGTFSMSGSICVAGVALSRPSWMSADALRRTGSDGRRCFLCGRRGTFSTSGSIGRHDTFSTFIDVRRSLATNWVGWAPVLSVWQAWRFQHVRFHLRGKRGAVKTDQVPVWTSRTTPIRQPANECPLA